MLYFFKSRTIYYNKYLDQKEYIRWWLKNKFEVGGKV